MPKYTVNFPVVSGELDDRNAAGVALLETGEDVSGAVLNRPLDVLRRRTETLRSEVEDLKYVVDSDRNLVMDCAGAISVIKDTTTNPHTLTFAIPAADTLRIRAAVGPGEYPLQAHVNIPAELDPVKNSRPGTYLQIRATELLRSYGKSGDTDNYTSSNNYVCEVAEGLEGSGVVVTYRDTWPQRYIKIVAAPGSTLRAVKTAIDAMPDASWPFETVLLNDTGPVDGEDSVDTTAQSYYFSGGAEPELHVITLGGLTDFFSDEANRLQDNDTLAIWYDDINAPDGKAGRRNSVPHLDDTETVVNNNLTNLRVHPERIPYAIPVCTRQGDFLVFVDGTRIKHSSSYTLGESLTRDGGVIHGNLGIDDNLTVDGYLLVKETAKVTTADPAVVPFVVEEVAGATANITEWRVKDAADPVAFVENDGDLRSKALDTVLATQDLSLGTKTVSKSVLISRTGANTTVQGDLLVAESTGLQAKLDTDVVLTITGKDTQSNDLTVWKKGATEVAQVDENGNLFAPSLDVAASAPNQTLRIGTTNADDVTIGQAGTEVLIPGELTARSAVNVLSLNVGEDPANPTASVTASGNLDAKDSTFTSVSIATPYNGTSLAISGSAVPPGVGTAYPVVDIKARNTPRDVVAVTGNASMTSAVYLQKWMAAEAVFAVGVDGLGKLVATQYVDVSAPAAATRATLTVKTATVGQSAITVQGASSQTAPLQSWLTFDGTATMAAVYDTGAVRANTFDTLDGASDDKELKVGTGNAASVSVAKDTVTTTVNGPLTVSGVTTVNNRLLVTPGAATLVPLSVSGLASQAKNLTEWYRGTTLSALVDSMGRVKATYFDTLATADQTGASDTLYVGTENASKITVGSGTATVKLASATSVENTLTVDPLLKSDVPLTIKGANDQTANLQVWQLDTSIKAVVSKEGGFQSAKVDTLTEALAGETRPLNIGTENATAITIGKMGVPLTISSPITLGAALPISYGGTGTTSATAGGVVYASTATAYAYVKGSFGQLLSQGSTGPEWVHQNSVTAGDSAKLEGKTWASPKDIGGAAAASGTFTTLTTEGITTTKGIGITLKSNSGISATIFRANFTVPGESYAVSMPFETPTAGRVLGVEGLFSGTSDAYELNWTDTVANATNASKLNNRLEGQLNVATANSAYKLDGKSEGQLNVATANSASTLNGRSEQDLNVNTANSASTLNYKSEEALNVATAVRLAPTAARFQEAQIPPDLPAPVTLTLADVRVNDILVAEVVYNSTAVDEKASFSGDGGDVVVLSINGPNSLAHVSRVSCVNDSDFLPRTIIRAPADGGYTASLANTADPISTTNCKFVFYRL